MSPNTLNALPILGVSPIHSNKVSKQGSPSLFARHSIVTSCFLPRMDSADYASIAAIDVYVNGDGK